ncbi:transposase [Bradyrhizobium sp. CNPSo 4010]|uniref:Transposase n=1 Tax=Bradyrhizobium agreste TaxID=2751811 RepID=A0ABS0Q147_9BRAD|nr:transposase [Bradyrhizobium agreste]
MKRARFADEQIIVVLKGHEAAAKTADPACKHGISEATIYNRKAKFGCMDDSEAKRLRALDRGEREAEKLLAEQMRGCGSEDDRLPLQPAAGRSSAWPFRDLANEPRRFGFRRLFVLLRR